MNYRICTRCIMDTSDPDIAFDDSGVCSHCRVYDQVMKTHVLPGDEGRRRMTAKFDEIRREGQGRRYDCIIGLSGGVDSSYVAWLVKQHGLRPLAVHLDNGWNTEAAVRNIENIVKILGIDLHTEVLDWEEFRDLQVAFLKASTPDSEIPTDHAIVASLYRAALREKVRFIVSGGNYVTELMVPLGWSNGHSDWKYIRTLNERFGKRRLKSFPHYSFFDKTYYFPKLKRIEVVSPLNWMEYDKFAVIEFLKREIGWVPYGAKHHESLYTRFYQAYILPRKFGADKRRPHLSCLVNDGRLTRDQALREIQQPIVDEDVLREEKNFVLRKLGLSDDAFEAIMSAPPKQFFDFPSDTRDPPVYHEVILAAERYWRSIAYLASRAARSPGVVIGAVYRRVRRAISGT
jgi:N-acetyl sugar amidotransferase